MTSQRQIDANRRKAQLSTGPRTLQGKAAVRYNGLRHGITARHAVLEGENPADFEETIRALSPELRPSYITCCDAASFPTLQNLSLLETRLERSFYRALHELERRQALRAGLFVPPPAVAEINASEFNMDLKNQSQFPDPDPSTSE